MDRLTKSGHFIPTKSTYTADDYARIYINEIVSFQGIPLSIILDRGSQFTFCFWKSFQKGLGTQVKLSSIFILRQMVKRNVPLRPLNLYHELVLFI